jgi:superfamily II DNA helicase RecQ
MYIRIFTIQVDAETGQLDDRALHQFSLEHQILSIKSDFYQQGDLPEMNVLVTYRPKIKRPSQQWIQTRQHMDPVPDTIAKVELTDAQKVVYERIRKWRNQKAEELGYRSMNVFYNNQLKELVQIMPKSTTELQKIEGIGKGRVEKYGDELLKVLHATPAFENCLDDGKSNDPKADSDA